VIAELDLGGRGLALTNNVDALHSLGRTDQGPPTATDPQPHSTAAPNGKGLIDPVIAIVVAPVTQFGIPGKVHRIGVVTVFTHTRAILVGVCLTLHALRTKDFTRLHIAGETPDSGVSILVNKVALDAQAKALVARSITVVVESIT